ncbi:hypothetical protein CALVIDRAFT_482078 [Calocera viscosa TUFC12733]|uniref:Uncharacterized protein n=1 Tax=Calocera viscosa (strain TUFC12733) TaxID=1330018 RepID=A0A167LVT6_CALVF|nr:hypothetical protein CALVIDRAFT_482078 [Calocera viscosa TUFC12733]
MPLPAHLHDHLRLQQQAILSRLHRSVAKPGELADPDGALAALGSLLSGTVERGEGNSCLVLGPQGSGKTRAVQLALTALPTQPIVVRLSGLTHPDDRSALRELQRQVLHSLGQRTPSPSATGAAQEEEDETAPFASLPPLPRPLVVVLSEFDVFCMRPRQALLYVLLDAVQSLRGGGVGIAVIGMTARIDCVNLLEKRVKSRFSHRIIRVTPAQSVEEYVALAREFFLPVDAALQDGRHEWTQLWSRSVEGLLADKQAVAMLRHTWELVHDLRLLQRVLTDAIARLTPDAPWLTIALLTRAITSQRGPTSFPHLPDLSAASLGLLIAVYQAGSAGHDVFTFQQLEHTYRAFARDHSSALGQGNGPAVPREGLIAAFDEFVRMKVFTPAALPFAPAMREFSKYRCAVDRREIEDAVRKGGSTGIRKWLKHWSGH